MKNKILLDLLQDDLSFDKAEKLQIKYSKYTSRINSNIQNLIPDEKINVIVAVDVSYLIKNEKEWGVGCAVFWNKTQNKFLGSSFAVREIKIPYKAGFLGFREAKTLSIAIKNAEIEPDLLVCDSHGLIHPKLFGEAIHLGVALNIPSFGIAKNPYIGFCDSKTLDRKKGNKIPIWEKNMGDETSKNKKLGYKICLADAKKPVYISIGFKIDIETAIKISLSLSTTHRQPEPLYLADIYSKAKIKEISKYYV